MGSYYSSFEYLRLNGEVMLSPLVKPIRIILFAGVFLFSTNNSAAPFSDDKSPVTPKKYILGELVKCSYKGRFESTKTIECQLKEGRAKDNLWKFSATENFWEPLGQLASQQVIIGYREGGIRHMDADFSLLTINPIQQNTKPKTNSICQYDTGKDRYSVGFRVARILSFDNDGDAWLAKTQLGGSGNLEPWAFRVYKEEAKDCYQQFKQLAIMGKKAKFYYYQDGKNDDYRIWRIDTLD